MTNDYLFRALLQRNNRVLKSLICSLLHLTADEISSVEIANSIELGAAIDEKEFILDIKVHMNSSATITLEMQVINEHNWVDRRYGIDAWASFFKAKTWEELKMLAHNNPDIQEAVTTVYQLTQEEKIRQQCEAREDYYRRQNDVQRWIKKQAETIKEQDNTIRELGDTIRERNDTIEELKQAVEKQAELINELRKQVAQHQSEHISNS